MGSKLFHTKAWVCWWHPGSFFTPVYQHGGSNLEKEEGKNDHKIHFQIEKGINKNSDRNMNYRSNNLISKSWVMANRTGDFNRWSTRVLLTCMPRYAVYSVLLFRDWLTECLIIILCFILSLSFASTLIVLCYTWSIHFRLAFWLNLK